MENNRFYVSGDKKVYLKVPDEFQKQSGIIVEFLLSEELAGRYLKLEVLSRDASKILANRNCSEEECKKCGAVDCIIHYGNAELHDVIAPNFKEKTEDSPIIPGHPNCHYGECDDCHVVSCSIQQGWSSIPELK